MPLEDLVLPPAVAKLLLKLDQIDTRFGTAVDMLGQMTEQLQARLSRLEGLAELAHQRGEVAAGSIHWAEVQLRQMNANLSRIADAAVALLRERHPTAAVAAAPVPAPAHDNDAASAAWEEWCPRSHRRN